MRYDKVIYYLSYLIYIKLYAQWCGQTWIFILENTYRMRSVP